MVSNRLGVEKMKRVLRFQLYQPTAHFRNPKMSQDDYIATLPLPPATTIVGMLSYLCDQKFDEEIKVAVKGNNISSKEIHFIRGERADFWQEYQAFIKKNKIENQTDGKYYQYFKRNVIANRIMNFEVLRDLELTIYLSASESLLEKIYSCLKNPKRYLALGRKEDFGLLGKKSAGSFEYVAPQLLEVKTKANITLKEALREKIKLDKCYLPIHEGLPEKILNAGPTYRLPYTYLDIRSEKEARQYQSKKCVYVDQGLYPEQIDVCYCEFLGKNEYFIFI